MKILQISTCKIFKVAWIPYAGVVGISKVQSVVELNRYKEHAVPIAPSRELNMAQPKSAVM